MAYSKNDLGVEQSHDEKGVRETIEKVLHDPTIPKLYANTFAAGYSPSDVYMVLSQNGEPVAVVNMSFTTAKSLQQALGATISRLEALTDHVIMTMDEVTNKGSID